MSYSQTDRSKTSLLCNVSKLHNKLLLYVLPLQLLVMKIIIFLKKLREYIADRIIIIIKASKKAVLVVCTMYMDLEKTDYARIIVENWIFLKKILSIRVYDFTYTQI